MVTEATERAPEERKYRRCVAFQNRTLDLDGSTTNHGRHPGSTQRDARKREVKYLTLRGGCPSVSVRPLAWFACLVLAVWAALALGVVACRLLSGPVVWPCRHCFFLVSKIGSDDPRNDLRGGIPRTASFRCPRDRDSRRSGGCLGRCIVAVVLAGPTIAIVLLRTMVYRFLSFPPPHPRNRLSTCVPLATR